MTIKNMTFKNKLIAIISGVLILTITIVTPIVVHNSANDESKVKGKKESNPQNTIDSVKIEDVRLIDSVGLQYAENVQQKNLQLINPSWVTNIKLDKSKLEDPSKKEITYKVKPDSLESNDQKGIIKYTVLLELANISKELNITYDNLPYFSETNIGIIQTPNNIMQYKKHHQFQINKAVKLNLGDLSKDATVAYSFPSGIDVSQVIKWPKNLRSIKWDGVVGLTSNNTPFQGDISTYQIFGSASAKVNLKGVDVSKVTKWPQDLKFINWVGVSGLLNSNTPFKEDASSFKISGSNLEGVDVSKVTKWSIDLSGINWMGAKFGQNGEGNPFKGDISTYQINNSKLKGIDVSLVTKWPTNLSGVNWMGAKFGQNGEGNPFKGDISTYQINNSKLKLIDISPVTKWPINLRGINWDGIIELTSTNTPFQGDISSHQISNSKLKGIDVSLVDQWPTDLSGINWDGVKGLSSTTTPFKDDISSFKISGSHLKEVDVSKVTKWSIDLSGINWMGVKFGPNGEGNPFKDDISSFKISGSRLQGVDVSQVDKWPSDIKDIVWKNVKSSLTTRPKLWTSKIWTIVKNNKKTKILWK